MGAQEIINKIQKALKTCSSDSSIDKKDIRIKLSIDKGFIMNDTLCHLMNKKEVLYPIELRTLLELSNPLQAKMVSTYLGNMLTEFAKKDNIIDTDVNARISTLSEDYYPRVHLFNGNKYIREITLEELTGN